MKQVISFQFSNSLFIKIADCTTCFVLSVATLTKFLQMGDTQININCVFSKKVQYQPKTWLKKYSSLEGFGKPNKKCPSRLQFNYRFREKSFEAFCSSFHFRWKNRAQGIVWQISTLFSIFIFISFSISIFIWKKSTES